MIYQHHLVIPAKVGTQGLRLLSWVSLGPRLGGGDGIEDIR